MKKTEKQVTFNNMSRLFRVVITTFTRVIDAILQ